MTPKQHISQSLKLEGNRGPCQSPKQREVINTLSMLHPLSLCNPINKKEALKRKQNRNFFSSLHNTERRMNNKFKKKEVLLSSLFIFVAVARPSSFYFNFAFLLSVPLTSFSPFGHVPSFLWGIAAVICQRRGRLSVVHKSSSPLKILHSITSESLRYVVLAPSRVLVSERCLCVLDATFFLATAFCLNQEEGEKKKITMLAKLKKVFSSDKDDGPKPKPKSAPPAKASPKPSAKVASPKAAPPGKSAAPPAAAPPACAEYMERRSKPGVYLLPDRNAVFEGTVDPESKMPIEGRAIYPSGTVLTGKWNKLGLFASGEMELKSAHTQQFVFVGDFVPTTAEQQAMSDAVGVRLAFGYVKDKNTKIVSFGFWDVWKSAYVRVSCGRRIVPVTAGSNFADTMPVDACIISEGEFNADKNTIKRGRVCSASVSSAGLYRFDGGVNYLHEGVMSGGIGLFQGTYIRRAQYRNGRHIGYKTCGANVGLWSRVVENSQLQYGRKLATARGTPQTSDAVGDRLKEINVVEEGSFSPTPSNSIRTGRRTVLAAAGGSSWNCAEGCFMPNNLNQMLCGLYITNIPRIASDDAATKPVVTARPDPTFAMQLRAVLHGGSLLLHRIWCSSELLSTQETIVRDLIAPRVTQPEQLEVICKAAAQMTNLLAPETLELEQAWYYGENCAVLSSGRGTVYFNENPANPFTFVPAGGGASFALMSQSRAVESAYLQQHVKISFPDKKSVLDAIEESLVHDLLQGGETPAHVLLPVRRAMWVVDEINLTTMEMTLGSSAFPEEDAVNLDKALCSGQVEPIQTSMGFVTVLAPLRILSDEPLPIGCSEEDRVLTMLSGRQIIDAVERNDGKRTTIVNHPLSQEATRLARVPSISELMSVRPYETAAPPFPEGTLRLASRKLMTIGEEFASCSFRKDFVMTNVGGKPDGAEEATEDRRPFQKFGVSALIHIPLSLDHCSQTFRTSWAFVLDFLTWVSQRFYCVPLLSLDNAPLQRLSYNAAPERREVFVQAAINVLDNWEKIMQEADGALSSATSQGPQLGVVTSSEPLWPGGIYLRYFGDNFCVTAAACEVSMWLTKCFGDEVRVPCSWTLSEAMSQPTSATEAANTESDVKADDATTMNVVDPKSEEFSDLHNILYGMSFPSTWPIVKVERVHNRRLYTRYVQKRRMISQDCIRQRQRSESSTAGCRELRYLAHGTRTVDPGAVVKGGFDHRYSEVGFFGRASYFAYDAVYSHSYRHEVSPAGHAQLFLAQVTAGNTELRDKIDKEIRRPQDGCHSIEGPLSEKFQGLMVYEVDQAYPTYLVTYKYA